MAENETREDQLDAMCRSLVRLLRLQAEGAALRAFRKVNGLEEPTAEALMKASQTEIENTLFATLRRFLREQA